MKPSKQIVDGVTFQRRMDQKGQKYNQNQRFRLSPDTDSRHTENELTPTYEGPSEELWEVDSHSTSPDHHLPSSPTVRHVKFAEKPTFFGSSSPPPTSPSSPPQSSTSPPQSSTSSFHSSTSSLHSSTSSPSPSTSPPSTPTSPPHFLTSPPMLPIFPSHIRISPPHSPTFQPHSPTIPPDSPASPQKPLQPPPRFTGLDEKAKKAATVSLGRQTPTRNHPQQSSTTFLAPPGPVHMSAHSLPASERPRYGASAPPTPAKSDYTSSEFWNPRPSCIDCSNLLQNVKKPFVGLANCVQTPGLSGISQTHETAPDDNDGNV